MATLGDLTYRVTADTRSFSAGLQQATTAAKGFGGGLTTQINALSAGVQDFAAVLGQGGANSLGRAFMASSNNISQLTASMGPMGGAIGGVAAVLASTLVPKLLEGGDATRTFADEIRDLTAGFEGLLKHQQTMVEFSDNWRQFTNSLKGVKTSDQAGSMIEAMGLKKEKLADEFENVKKNIQGFLGPDGMLADVGFKAMQQGKEGALNIPANLTREQLLGAAPETVEWWLGKDFKSVADEINKQVAEFKKLQREVDQTNNQFQKLKDKQAALNGQEKLQAAGGLGIGVVGEDIAARQSALRNAGLGIGAVTTEAMKREARQNSGALARGSMEEAVARLNAKQDPEQAKQTQLLKDSVSELKEANRALRRVGRQDIRVVQLP